MVGMGLVPPETVIEAIEAKVKEDVIARGLAGVI
jgi:hypothetical protein